MKKYVTPLLEFIQVEQINNLAAGTIQQGQWGDAKENNMFLFDDEEFEDENDLWNNNSHKDDYNLWED